MLFTQEEVDAVERYNARQEGLHEGRQEGARNRDRLARSIVGDFPDSQAPIQIKRVFAGQKEQCDG